MSNSVVLESSWKDALAEEFAQPYWQQLTNFVRAQYQQNTVYPPASQIFRAFDSCPFDSVRVVIVGQDPYHGPNQACGLSFNVANGVPWPPSLRNIYKELCSDLGADPADPELQKNFTLEHLPAQGVLLLNSVLTVEAGKPASHANKGWEVFTDAALEQLSARRSGLVYLLWGAYAQKKGEQIDQEKNLVLRSGHPSPLSARLFFGNNHFSSCNTYLQLQGEPPIEWLNRQK